MKEPGLVVRIHGKDHESIEVQFKDRTVTARNIIRDLKIGDYVILNEDLAIQKLTEHEALKMMH
ncbi:TPA: HypC/HybG/HupF family hydrogenase formation chaperone [Candidatus Woesearchaeota archaeon]|nr:HypC/HybG/HupF family hydrogenase formation chaperone [Candidatus Woesearchaeota archaeon]HIH31096.1 HypC/HybG/HupF family hydrogenase formation chaperone [Candidatus Woesearchaeota archaeon]HIH55604.1 HypC/HybG/HupF family hydrogenase formation chaperone [Candidatus Woesearchaeota archaeon]HIJ01206.1 HypC/HybG/HupF family hydrogenase formation chaperone [Candidatus Woesearchaeota archaeon]HIJ14488.1 HypC/HybG/HupF family hydrogenase formation chaperone [Candidatus Woesearchaeota archaeon]